MTATPDGLDVVASRTGDNVCSHVVNTNRTAQRRRQASNFGGDRSSQSQAYEIADDPMVEISNLNSRDVMQAARASVGRCAGRGRFRPASVTAVEVELRRRGA